MHENIEDIEELVKVLDLPDSLVNSGRRACTGYPLRVPKSYVEKMVPGDPEDPLLLQVLPQHLEGNSVGGYVPDPLEEFGLDFGEGDEEHSESETCPFFIQKYAGRVLLVATDRCAVHCRFCFRRFFKTKNHGFDLEKLRFRVEEISKQQNDPEKPPIFEVILSGGDPLTCSDEELEFLVQTLAAIPKLRRIRIHTRMPVVVPQRITGALVFLLKPTLDGIGYPVVLHVNHAREIDGAFATAIAPLLDQGTPIFVQSVLLRGVNDDFESLFELYERCISLRLIPYYLHRLDRVAGAAHFEVPLLKARKLMERLREHLPGYAVPRFVEEIPNLKSKKIIE